MLTKLDGYETYLVMAALLAVVALEKGLGLDVPGMALGEDWMLVMMNAIRLVALALGSGKGGEGGLGPEVPFLRMAANGRFVECFRAK
jgi:hypothetical protein